VRDPGRIYIHKENLSVQGQIKLTNVWKELHVLYLVKKFSSFDVEVVQPSGPLLAAAYIHSRMAEQYHCMYSMR